MKIHNEGFAEDVIITNIYCPPKNQNKNYQNFICDISLFLKRLNRINCELLVLGDFNIDLLKLREKPIIMYILTL